MNKNSDLYRLSLEEFRLVLDFRRMVRPDQRTILRFVHEAPLIHRGPPVSADVIPFPALRTAP